jgi:predicted ArsR family transcriptional regulator
MQVTRQRILEILKERAAATVEELGKELDLTPVTIRHHLDILRSEGLVQAPKVKRRDAPGRPQHVYALTDAADEYFPKNYAGFADLMLHEIRERVEPQELDSILHGVAKRMVDQAPPQPPGEAMPQRVERVVRFLTGKGYNADWEMIDGGYIVRAHNCPYHDIAKDHIEPCVMDMAMISQMLGQTPQRLEWMVGGNNACVYLVKAGSNGEPAK